MENGTRSIAAVPVRHTHWVMLAAMDAATPPSQKGYGAFFFFGGVTRGAGVLTALTFCCGLSLMVEDPKSKAIVESQTKFKKYKMRD